MRTLPRWKPTISSNVTALIMPVSADAPSFNGLGFFAPEVDGRRGEYYSYKGVEAICKKYYDLAARLIVAVGSVKSTEAEKDEASGKPAARPR